MARPKQPYCVEGCGRLKENERNRCRFCEHLYQRKRSAMRAAKRQPSACANRTSNSEQRVEAIRRCGSLQGFFDELREE